MPDYRRAYTPGGAIFLTLVTFNRRPIFAEPDNVKRLRQAAATVKAEMPFDITAAVILPDHIHFVWTLPPDDDNYSKRVGRLKVLFTRSLKGSLPYRRMFVFLANGNGKATYGNDDFGSTPFAMRQIGSGTSIICITTR
jgi:REP element-mobilizing transposase RayT